MYSAVRSRALALEMIALTVEASLATPRGRGDRALADGGIDANKPHRSLRGYKRGYGSYCEVIEVNIHAVCGPSLDRFHTTNKTSKGVRLHPPDALCHW